MTTGERVMYPKNLHLQFHGREIHTLCFISQDSSCSLNEKQDIFSEMIWVATGCEDGTVRLTRYDAISDFYFYALLNPGGWILSIFVVLFQPFPYLIGLPSTSLYICALSLSLTF